MSVVAVIKDPAEPDKIIAWAKQQKKDPQLTICARSPRELAVVPV
jgi:hypothetical protein